MEREEFKKKLIENYKSKIKVKFDCKWTKCNECPFYNRVCPSDDDMYQKVMEEAWAEINGYIKKEDLRPKVNVEDTEKDVNDLTYTPSKPGKYTDNDGKLIPQELSSISCVLKIKDKWDYLKDTLKVIYEQETCISKKDAYKKVIKIMEEYEA